MTAEAAPPPADPRIEGGGATTDLRARGRRGCRPAAALALALAAALGACAPDGAGGDLGPRVSDPALRGEADLQLAQSAARAANALETLALVQRSRTPVPGPSVEESALPEDLRARSTVTFNGPASAALRDLAANVGYSFHETGNPPSAPPLVNVVARDQAVGRVLADIGLQVQRVATVVVDPGARRIELRHEPGAEGPSAARSAARAGQPPRTRPARHSSGAAGVSH